MPTPNAPEVVAFVKSHLEKRAAHHRDAYAQAQLPEQRMKHLVVAEVLDEVKAFFTAVDVEANKDIGPAGGGVCSESFASPRLCAAHGHTTTHLCGQPFGHSPDIPHRCDCGVSV